MFNLAIIFAATVFFFKAAVAANVHAELYEYKPRDASKSEVLLLNKPLTIQGRVQLHEDSGSSESYLNIEMKALNQIKYNLFDTISFNKCTGTGSFYCVQRQKKNDYDIYLRTTVVSNFNQSEWRLMGLYNEHTFVSNSVKLPFIPDTLQEVQVTLLKYNYTNTRCTKDLLINEPIYLEGKINFMDYSEDSRYLDIEKGHNNSYNLFGTLFFDKCNASDSFYCNEEENNNTFRIFLNAIARAEFNQSEWRLRGKYKGREFFSNAVQLPTFFNFSDVKLTLNNKVVSQKNTSFVLSVQELELCCPEAPSDCKAVITINSKIEVNGSPCVIYRPNGTEESVYHFGFYICDIFNFTHIYSLNVTMKPKEDSRGSYIWVIIASVAGSPFIIIGFVVCFCKRVGRSYETVRYTVVRNKLANYFKNSKNRYLHRGKPAQTTIEMENERNDNFKKSLHGKDKIGRSKEYIEREQNFPQEYMLFYVQAYWFY